VAVSVVTGFPGFIGRRLVARLVAGDPDERVVALVEERQLEPAREVAAGIDPERIELIAADISKPRLGLGEDEYRRLAAEATRVFHLAAIYNLSVPLAVAQAVNVDGTGNVLELCEAAENLDRLVYISTAYVAGLRTGAIYEHELVMGQDFKNHYESTKFQAEVWVREWMGRVPTTILRPAIVVGDSKTGETEKFDGPYYILRSISLAHSRGRALPQFGRSDAAFNVVPVDYVVDAIAAAADDPKTLGETLHLVDPDPLSARELFELLSQTYAGRSLSGRIPAALVKAGLHLPAVRNAFSGAPPQSITYLNHPAVYDARRAVELLSPHGLKPPLFTDYVEPVVDFFRRHEDDPALIPPPV